MELKPSQIFFSQDSVMNKFGDYTPHGNILIGETLDQLLSGKCDIEDIPKISVVDIDGKWFTTDNRRLWVFRKAEELGFLRTIEVQRKYNIKEDKLTTENEGSSVRVRGRGGPGGRIWKTWKPKQTRKTYSNTGYSNTTYNTNSSATSVKDTKHNNPHFSMQIPISSNRNVIDTNIYRNNNSIPTYQSAYGTANQSGHGLTFNKPHIATPTSYVNSNTRDRNISNTGGLNQYIHNKPTTTSIPKTESIEIDEQKFNGQRTNHQHYGEFNDARVSGRGRNYTTDYREPERVGEHGKNYTTDYTERERVSGRGRGYNTNYRNTDNGCCCIIL